MQRRRNIGVELGANEIVERLERARQVLGVLIVELSYEGITDIDRETRGNMWALTDTFEYAITILKELDKQKPAEAG